MRVNNVLFHDSEELADRTMPSGNLEAVLLTEAEPLFSSLRYRFAESGVDLTLARDQNGFKNALRKESVGAVILDSAATEGILRLSVEEAVVKLAPILAPRIIMVLAGHDIPPERIVKLLELGAHDVVQSPVKPRILAEQLKALVRVFGRKQKRDRKTLSSPSHFLVMDYPRRRCLITDQAGGPPSTGEDVRLTKAEFQVLYFLLQKKGAVVTYEDFRVRLWPTAYSTKDIIHTLHQLTANIRKKIASCPVKIENLRAEGFRLV